MNSKENDGSPAASSSRIAGACDSRLRVMITRLTVRRQFRTTARLANRPAAPHPLINESLSTSVDQRTLIKILDQETLMSRGQSERPGGRAARRGGSQA